MEDIKEKGLKIYDAIFEGKKIVEIDEIEYPIKKFSSGIKYLDLFGYIIAAMINDCQKYFRINW